MIVGIVIYSVNGMVKECHGWCNQRTCFSYPVIYDMIKWCITLQIMWPTKHMLSGADVNFNKKLISKSTSKDFHTNIFHGFQGSDDLR